MNDWVNDYLIHHGILGQKWGIRRFQYKDGSLTDKGRARYAVNRSREDYILKTGTKFRRISSEQKETKNGRIKWANYDEQDIEKYKNFIPDTSKKERYAHTLESNKSLKVASTKTYNETMMEIIGNKTINELRESKEYADAMDSNNAAAKAFIERYGDKTVTETRNDIYNRLGDLKPNKNIDPELQNAWRTYDNGVERTFERYMAAYDHNQYSQAFVKLLKEKGYDAVEDEWSRYFDGTNHAVIILDPDISTKTIDVERIRDNSQAKKG